MNIIAPINQLGYGITGLNIVKSLYQSGHRVALWCLGQPQVTNQNDADIISEVLKNAQLFNYTDPCVRIWHQHDMSQFVGKGTRIGFPIFELNTFSDIEKHHLNSLDKLFVCSKWAKNVAIQNLTISSDNIHVIPLGVDISIFNTQPSSAPNISSDKTIFFNCGKWEIRKGHDVIPEIFSRAFNKDDNVELWMMCGNPFLKESEQLAWENLYKSSKLGNKIRFISRVQTQEEVYNIMNMTDCGLFPARAEGWNLELLEMMACGKHVITTNYSAHTEFCTDKNSHLIEINQYEVAYDGKWFFGDKGDWASLSDDQINQAAEYCRSIHRLKQETESIVNLPGIETANNFTWKNSASEILIHA